MRLLLDSRGSSEPEYPVKDGFLRCFPVFGRCGFDLERDLRPVSIEEPPMPRGVAAVYRIGKLPLAAEFDVTSFDA